MNSDSVDSEGHKALLLSESYRGGKSPKPLPLSVRTPLNMLWSLYCVSGSVCNYMNSFYSGSLSFNAESSFPLREDYEIVDKYEMVSKLQSSVHVKVLKFLSTNGGRKFVFQCFPVHCKICLPLCLTLMKCWPIEDPTGGNAGRVHILEGNDRLMFAIPGKNMVLIVLLNIISMDGYCIRSLYTFHSL